MIHIFSHIKKTYRVQWVLLEGGTPDPPILARLTSAVDDGERLQEAKSSEKARKARRSVTRGHERASHTFEAKWTLMDDVPNAK